MSRASRTGIGLAAMALVVSAALAAAPTSEVMGRVEDAQGNPIVGAVVTLTSTVNDKAVYEGKTDKKGRYFVAGLLYYPPGLWKVAVKAEGYAPSQLKVESKTQAAIVAKFETKLRLGAAPEEVPIRPFGEAKIDFVMVPADQAQAEAAAAAAAASPSSPARSRSTDSMVLAAEKVSQGDLEGAVEHYRKAIEEKPDDVARREELGKVLFQLDRYGDAEAQVLKAVEMAPERVGLNRLLASIYVATDRYSKAWAALGRERQLVPQDTAVLGLVAQLAEEMNKDTEAIEANEALVRINPDNVQAWLSLGNLYAAQGAADKSEAAFRRVVDLDPKNAYQTFYNIGAVIMNKPSPSQAETRKAIEAFRKAVEIKPDYDVAHRQLAFALLNVGDIPSARKAIERYLELAPKASDAADLRAMLSGLPK